MIGIKVNGVSLALTPETEAELQVFSAMLADELQDDFSMPFSVPRAGNEQVLLYVNELAVHERVIEFPDAVLEYAGARRRTGVLYVEQANENQISVSFTVTGFSSTVRDLRLPQMDMGDPIITTGILDYAKAVNLLAWPAAPCCFPMYSAPNFYGSENPDWAPDAQEWDIGTAYTVNQFVTYTTQVYVSGSPVRYTFTYQCIANTTAQAPELNPTKWRRTAFGIVNHWNWTTEQFLANTDTNNFYTLSPCFYLKRVLQAAFAGLGYAVGGEFFDDPRYDRLFLYNNHALDKGAQSAYFLAHQVGALTVSGDGLSTARVPGQNESIAPNQDASNVWDNVLMRWKCPSTGTFTLRAYVPHEFVGEEHLQVSMVKEVGDVVVSYQIHPNISDIFVGYSGINTFTFTATSGDVGQWYYFAAKLSWGAPLLLQNCWLEGWKNENSVVNQFADTIVPSEHVPDIEFAELLQDLKTIYGVKLTTDAEQHTAMLDYAQGALDRAAVEMTTNVRSPITIDTSLRTAGITWSWPSGDNSLPDLATLTKQGEYASYAAVPNPNGPGVWCLVLADRRVLISKRDPAGYAWYPSGWLFDSFTIGDAVNATSRTPVLAPMQSAIVGVELETFLVPSVPDKCTSRYFVSEAGQASKLIAFYHGMQPNNTGKLYPFASPFAYRMDGVAIDSPELDWPASNGPIGLHQQVLGNALVNADAFTCDLEVTMEYLDQRLYELVQLIHGQRCLVQSMSVTLADGRGALITKNAKLFRLRNDDQVLIPSA